MFGSKKNKSYVDKPEDHESIIDIYTAPDDLGEEHVETFTADEANKMAHNYVENEFEELKSNIIESIKSDAGVGRYKTNVNTLSEELAIKACEYMRAKGYKATCTDRSIYAGDHIVLQGMYSIDISWSDDNENA